MTTIENDPDLRVPPGVPETGAGAGQKRGAAIAAHREELVPAHREQGNEHGDEAEGVDEEADADADAGDDDPGERRPDRPARR